MQNQDGFAESMGPSQTQQSFPSPQPSNDVSTASPSNKVPSSNRGAIQRSSANRTEHGQNPASCTLCRRRKVKCDRSVPCGTCVRAGAQCVPSIPSKAPRGRQGGRKRKMDGELLERLAKLETLVKTFEGDSNQHETAMDHTFASDPREESLQNAFTDGHDPSKGAGNGAWDRSRDGSNETRKQSQSSGSGLGLNKYLGSSFWVTLSEEINGLKDVLNSSSDEDDEAEDGQTEASSLSSHGPQQPQQTNDSSFLFPQKISMQSPSIPTSHQLYTFCDVYLKNVDPVLKVLHAPSLRRYLQEGAPVLDCSPGARGLEALRFAICYAATLSMTDGECRRQIGEDREVLMAKYRAGTESALAKADFVNTVEMSTLQAMAIYLVINPPAPLIAYPFYRGLH